MNSGRVYIWTPDPGHPLHGRVSKQIVPLPRLDAQGPGKGRLWGHYVRVRNAGMVNEPGDEAGTIRPVAVGDAEPNSDGDFLFEPGRGGGRIDKVALAEQDFRQRYIEAAHFGEVNTYYHLDRVAAYVDELLGELGVPSLPRIDAVVNAHHGATERGGLRDGVRGTNHWLPFQGGHYRLPGATCQVVEYEPISHLGEIHLGPGWRLLEHGALVEAARDRYRANASHNAGILYHEYGHHLTRHTADFRANALRAHARQNNRKTALDEGTCDYLAATMLATPHIWAWHHRHDSGVFHPRSLVSRKTMADYDSSSDADPHLNGTIWGSALWDFRTRAQALGPEGARHTDLLLLQALVIIGELTGDKKPPTVKRACAARDGFCVGLRALIRADEILFCGRHRSLLQEVFLNRGIFIESPCRPTASMTPPSVQSDPVQMTRDELIQSCVQMKALLKHATPDEIPETQDLHSSESLEFFLKTLNEPPLSLVAVGDIMLGGRAKTTLSQYGQDYPFAAVLPLLRRAPIGLGNLEGPFAQHAEKQERRFCYRVNPRLAKSLRRAGINVVTLANNHLLDCGRGGVLETLGALSNAGVAAIGAGVNRDAAHLPAIFNAGQLSVGLLGYYWNRRTSATKSLPGSAMDPPEALASDIIALRKRVDRVVVTFHWGVPYVREPSAEDRAKARLAIDCGADAVIGHHPHIIQPFEVYRDRPIFFSVGNFAFGSGNSRGESLLVGLRFSETSTVAHIYPVYVKNRDPRVNYQPKILRDAGAERVLRKLADISGSHAQRLTIEACRGAIILPSTQTV